MKEVHGQYSQTGSPGTHSGAGDLIWLIEQCKSKNRSAQKQLYDKFSPILYAKIRRYVPVTASAQEILNDSFLKIFTNLESYNASGAFEGWMYRITINTVTDHLRKNIKYDQIPKVDPDFHEVPVPETIVGKLAYKELLQVVHSLPDVQRGVFNMFVFDHFSHKEIAEQLGITENNSRWHLNDARRRLKEKLDAM